MLCPMISPSCSPSWTFPSLPLFPAPLLKDAGVLKCSLRSAAGLQSPIIAIEPHSAAVRVGETATFRCRVYSGAQPVRLEWKVANSQHLPGKLHTVVLLNEGLSNYIH